MRALTLVAVITAMASACAGQPAPTAAHSARPSPQVSVSPSPSPSSAVSPSPAATPEPSPQPTPQPVASVTCVPGLIPTSEALFGASTTGEFLYDVDDPVHPRVACRIENTWVHILTATSLEYLVPKPDGTTNVVLHALGSNNESVAASLKADLTTTNALWVGPVAWTSDLSRLAYMADGGNDADGLSVTDVWVATASSRTRIFSYSVPGKDSFGRPGFAPVTLGFSADGAYLAAGWNVSTSPIHVFRVSDGANVSPVMPADLRFASWSKSGATLYLVGTASVGRWTPGSNVTTLTPLAWTLNPSFSPDGTKVAFTVVTSTRQVRTYVYDIAANSDHLTIEQPRSSAAFVKAGWLWQWEEKTCVRSDSDPCFDPTEPDGNLLAYDIATGHETRVVFSRGESPSAYGLTPGDLWPNA